MNREEALVKLKVRVQKNLPEQRPLICLHRLVDWEAYQTIPGCWSPGFVKICAVCGEELE